MVGYYVVNIRNVRRGRANKRDGSHRPMAAATGMVDITLPVAIGATAYMIGQGVVDASGCSDAAEGKDKPYGYNSTQIEFFSAAKSPLHSLYSPLSALRRAMRPQSSNCPKYSCREARC